MDICDEANARADLFRENVLNAARQTEFELPLFIGGVRCCLDCEGPIPAERLNVNPDAVRCVECQTRREKDD